MTHTCHARRCGVAVAPRMLMCRRHWYMVPADLRTAVWNAYRPGQEQDKRPSASWIQAAENAIEAVDRIEAGAVSQRLL